MTDRNDAIMLGRNFSLREFTRSSKAEKYGIDNSPPPDHVINLRELVEFVLQPVRNHFNRPIKITSGYRCHALNTLVGGVPTSQHARGEAADFIIPEHEGEPAVPLIDIAEFINDQLGFDQLILESPPDGWIHVSFSPQHRREALTMFDGKYYEGLLLSEPEASSQA